MLRDAENAGFTRREGWISKRYVFADGDVVAEDGLTPADLAWAAAAQETQALCVLDTGEQQYWWCRGRFYVDDERRSPEHVYALVSLVDARHETEPTPLAVRREVFARDGGRCAECGSGFDIRFGHVVPPARGGTGTADNLRVLCAPCDEARAAAAG
jgi:hypothetical protein